MNEYISSGKELLKMLINNGFEAYFIGEVVRNTILNKPITRIDITTLATADDIKRIFKNCEIEDITNNSVKVLYNNYDFYIQTFMISDGIDNNTMLNKHYSKNLLDDLANRDFTINAIAMSHSGKLTDAYDGYNDIKKKRISHIGNAKIRFSKDPSIMIKAFALMSELNYTIVRRTKNAIAKRRKNIETVEIGTYYEYLEKVFSGKYAKKAIVMMDNTNIERSIPSLKWVIHYLSNHYKAVDIEEVLLMAFVHSGSIDERYQPYIKNFSSFVNIFTLACTNKKGNYDVMTLFANGLDDCLKANRINYLLKKSWNKSKKIKKAWNELPVKRVCDLAYKGQDIMNIISQNDYPLIGEIIDDVLLDVLNNEIPNDYDAIEKKVLSILTKKGIKYNLNGFSEQDNEVVEKIEEAKEEPKREVEDLSALNKDDYTNYRLDMLEAKIEEQAKLLEERNQQLDDIQKLKLKNDIDILTEKSVEYITNNDNLKYMVKDQEKFKDQFKEFIFNYIKSEDNNG